MTSNTKHYHQTTTTTTKTTTPTLFHVSLDGAAGKDAPNGAHGRNGVEMMMMMTGGARRRRSAANGTPGERGQNAGMATVGGPGGRATIFLSTTTSSSTNKKNNDQQEQQKIVVKAILVKNQQQHSTYQQIIPVEERIEQEIDLSSTINVTARGGKGGNGGRGGNGGNGDEGYRGNDATRYQRGTNGGPGGAGGDAGDGSSGQRGGDGGEIHYHVSDEDSYLLMAIQNCENNNTLALVAGGRGGSQGSPGTIGLGGPGGRGGAPYTYSDGDGGGTQTTPGWRDGPDGPNGLASTYTHKLRDGDNGDVGLFTIHITGSSGGGGGDEQKFASRYDLHLVGTTMQGFSPNPLDTANTNNFFQFGDTISLRNIQVRNSGGMISPQQKSEILILPSTHIVPTAEDVLFVNERIMPGRVFHPSDGSLSFHVPVPNIRAMGDDIEPYTCQDRLFLQCQQLGPNSNNFARLYSAFDTRGTLFHFGFPVINLRGLEGLPTIRPGDGTQVKFSVHNTSPVDLGIHSASGRQIFVQFYRNDANDFDVTPHHVTVQMTADEENALKEISFDDETRPHDETIVWRGTSFPIEFLASGESRDITGFLKLSAQVAPYSRFALRAEIVLQDLPTKNISSSEEGGPPSFSPIQRRQLEIATEPTYYPSKMNKVVLVTSSETTKDEFTSWNRLLNEQLGLGVEYYSVSIYGSLHPTFELPNNQGSNTQLAECFRAKLIVVLDDAFNPLDENISAMHPSCMLPNGCQSQSSGFHESTKWLLVGSSTQAIEQALNSHFNAPPTDAESYDSTSDFYRRFEQEMQAERAHGVVEETHIREDVIQTDTRAVLKEANRVRQFLEQSDRLRQYIVTVDPKLQKSSNGKDYRRITVRRGYCRSENSVWVLRNKPTKHNDSLMNTPTMFLAIVQALPFDTLVRVFCLAAKKSKNKGDTSKDPIIEACLDAFTEALLWDLSNFLDGKFRVNDEQFATAFPTLSQAARSEDLGSFLNEDPQNPILSRLIARFQCVATARDLSPRWLPWSRKHAIRKALLQLVSNLEEQWSVAIIPAVKQAEITKVEGQVEEFVKREYSCCCGLISTARWHGHWRRGLLSLHSHRNREKGYRELYSVHRLIEINLEEDHRHPSTTTYTKKPRPIVPSKRVVEEVDCRALRSHAARQLELADQLLASIQSTRADQEIRSAEEDIPLDDLNL